MNVRVLLVDDHHSIRSGLRCLLEGDAGIEVVGEAADGLMALALVKSLAPDVVVMDVAMPGMNGIEATRLIRAEDERMRVVAISTFSDPSYVDSMYGAGACGYVLKIEAHDKLVPAVHAARRDERHPTPETAQRIVAPLTASVETPARAGAAASPPWKELLAEPGACGHIVQLYQDDDFYGEAICHYATEGLKKNEAVILVPTAPHWELLSHRLADLGFDVEDLLLRGQLVMLDADETLPLFLVEGMPDASAFKARARSVIAAARASGRTRVRWWGEMVNVLYVDGNLRGSSRLEELFDELAHEESIAVFCSFLMDPFDESIYAGPLDDVCRTHAHLIPAQDYALHRECVDRAIAEVFVAIEDSQLGSLDDFVRARGASMPYSQAVLLWLREAHPVELKRVLELARAHERGHDVEMAEVRPARG